MDRKTVIAANWKMHGDAAHVDAFARAVTAADGPAAVRMLVCVPFVYLERMAAGLRGSGVAAGAQNLAAEIEPGAFTGEVNGAMLRDAGCGDVIVGHSERRARYGETDAVVAAKTQAAVAAGLAPIVCVGETLAQREAERTQAVLAAQVAALFEGCAPDTLAGLCIAYEPVWAIGTGRSASPEQAQAVHAFIRARIADYDSVLAQATPLLYGGSVKPDNARALFAEADVDGALVGGASLEAASFLGIAAGAV